MMLWLIWHILCYIFQISETNKKYQSQSQLSLLVTKIYEKQQQIFKYAVSHTVPSVWKTDLKAGWNPEAGTSSLLVPVFKWPRLQTKLNKNQTQWFQ